MLNVGADMPPDVEVVLCEVFNDLQDLLVKITGIVIAVEI